MAILGNVIAVAVLSYFIGSTPWGFLIGKFNGLDMRKHGSGNIGATNVRRVLGRDWGIVCFVCDFLKGLLPVIICSRMASSWAIGSESARLIAALMAVSGHMWPFWLRFRGGKGVSTTIGALIAVSPVAVLAALITWVLIFFTSRYVSLASLCAAVMLPLSHGVRSAVNRSGVLSPTLLLLLILASLIIIRHRSNLKRLATGSEYRFGSAKGKI